MHAYRPDLLAQLINITECIQMAIAFLSNLGAQFNPHYCLSSLHDMLLPDSDNGCRYSSAGVRDDYGFLLLVQVTGDCAS